jgi:transcriptional regulator with XRE-family HTH domain
VDRSGLADFLRRRRAQLQPADVGLPPGARRRTPGLRRDEVAMLAAMSSDYYTRLEQSRGPRPSRDVLAALARALRLSDDERDHLFNLAGQVPPPRWASSGHVSPGLMHILDRLTDTPAFVVSDLGETLAQNPMSRVLSGDAMSRSGRGRSFAWSWFLDPRVRSRYPREDWDQHSRTHVADLRATYGRRRGEPDVEALVADLLAHSEEFARRWEAHEVLVRRADSKRIIHPEVGVIDLLCESLTSDVGAQTLVVLYPRPGSEARAQLELVRVIGTQDLAAAEPSAR